MKKIYLLGAAFLISLGITGCTPATTTTPPASKPASTVEQQEKEVSLTIYRPTEDAMYLVPATMKMKLKDDPPKAALAAMIADDRKQKYPILPKGLSVNTVKVKDGIATVDFSKELLNMDKSTTTEELFTAMTVNTLTEFPDIKEVKFLMNGKAITHLSGHSDMTRTVCVGQSSEKMGKIYDIVLKAQLEALKKVKSGITGSELDGYARDIIDESGYGDFFGHSLGHGVGMEIHEFPTASSKSETILKENMVVTVEPGIYLPGEFGVRIEDFVVVTENSHQNLTNCPKKLIIL